MKKSLLAWGMLALGVVAPNASAQTERPVAEWRQAGVLERPVTTDPVGTEERDRFGLAPPRVQHADVNLGAPKSDDAHLPEVPVEANKLPDVVKTTTRSSDRAVTASLGDPAATPATAPPVSFAPESTQGGFFIGAGIYFAQPVFSANPAFVSSVNNTVSNPNTTITQTQSFDWNFQATPKIWMGYVCENGWGFAFNFWHFQADPDTLVVLHPADPPGIQSFGSTLGALPIPVRSNFPPIPADVIQINSTLQLDTYDFEVIWTGAYERGYVKAGAGARYAYLRQRYSASLINTGNPPNFLQDESNTFSGGGPTISGEVGCRVHGRWGLYGMGRLSLLFGQSSQEATQLQSGVNPALAFTSNNDRMAAIPVGELEMGISWQADWNRCRFIVKTGVAGQMWWDAGSASIPAGGSFASLSALSPQTVFFPVSTATSSNLGFLGWTFSIGLNY